MGIRDLNDIRVTDAHRTVLDLVAQAQLRDGEPPTVDAIVLMRPHEVAQGVRDTLAQLVRDDFLSPGRSAGGKEDVRLTPTGLFVCRYNGEASALAESILAYYKQRLQADGGDFHRFTWEDLKKSSVGKSDDDFVRILVVTRTLRLANERTVVRATATAMWDVPDDIVDFRGLSDVEDLYRRAEQQRLQVANVADAVLTPNTNLQGQPPKPGASGDTGELVSSNSQKPRASARVRRATPRSGRGMLNGSSTSPSTPDSRWKLLVAAASRVPGGVWIFSPVALGAAAALILGLALGSAKLAFFGVLFTFTCVVLFYAFAKGTAHLKALTGPLILMVWGTSMLFVLVLLTLYTCVFWGKPLDLRHWINEQAAHAVLRNGGPREPASTIGGTGILSSAQADAAVTHVFSAGSSMLLNEATDQDDKLLAGGDTANKSTTKQNKAEAWLMIDGFEWYDSYYDKFQIQVTADVNGTKFRYPSKAGVEWLEVGPNMAGQVFHLPPTKERYIVRFEALARRWSQSGRTFEFRQFASMEESFIDVRTGIPAGGKYELHMVVSGARGAAIAASVRFRLSPTPD